MNSVLLVSSALLLHLALHVPKMFAGLVFVAFAPLLYGALRKYHHPWRAGFFWGLIFFSFHFAPYFMLQEPLYCSVTLLVGYFFFVVYAAAITGCWFFITTVLAGVYSTNAYIKILVWVTTLFLFLQFASQGLLCIVGSWVGDPFINVLIPLAQYPCLLYCLPFMGSLCAVALVVVSNGLLALYFFTGRTTTLVAVLVVTSPFLFGCLVPARQNLRKISAIAWLAPGSTMPAHPLDMAEFLCQRLDDIISDKPDAILLLAPESTYRFCLMEQTKAVAMLQDSFVSHNLSVMVGSYKKEQDILVNCLYLLENNQVVRCFCKERYVPFIEYVPYSSCSIPQKINISDRIINLPKLGTCHVYICSDFYLGTIAQIPAGHKIVLCAHDRWSRSSVIPRYMFLYALLKACELSTDIIYVAHTGAWILGKDGSCNKL